MKQVHEGVLLTSYPVHPFAVKRRLKKSTDEEIFKNMFVKALQNSQAELLFNKVAAWNLFC